MPDIDISPADADEAELLLASSRSTYAAGLRTQRGFSVEDADRKVFDDVAALLPDGKDTPGHLLLVARDEDGYVGGIWAAVQGPDRPGMAWIYHVWVEPAARGQRLSQRLISAAGDVVRALGADSLGLNVFGDNIPAIATYVALGFTVTAQQMSLSLSNAARQGVAPPAG